MQDHIEASGKNVEEAIGAALLKLGAKRTDVRWDVLEAGGRRMLGLFGARAARVRVERVVRHHADPRALILELLQTMHVDAEVEVRQDSATLEVQVQTRGLDGLLIGRHGETLAALQHVVARLVSKEFGFHGAVQVDVGGYRCRREAQLADKARVLAEKVQASGREIRLEPLHAHDRRVVHTALAGLSGIRTYTAGQGLHRSVVIAPRTRGAARVP
jgi:spoIIIJ-associated protein